MGQSFKLKGSLFTLSVLQLMTADLEAFDADLKAKIQLAPKFFNCTPMVIDVQALKVDRLDFQKLKSVLQNNQVIAVGIKGAPTTWLNEIREAHLAVMNEPVKSDKKAGGNASTEGGSKIISEPVRSGQRIYAEGGDLIIIGTVSSGAEILADGNIHV
jgi:septum site-determining protein MinC